MPQGSDEGSSRGVEILAWTIILCALACVASLAVDMNQLYAVCGRLQEVVSADSLVTAGL